MKHRQLSRDNRLQPDSEEELEHSREVVRKAIEESASRPPLTPNDEFDVYPRRRHQTESERDRPVSRRCA